MVRRVWSALGLPGDADFRDDLDELTRISTIAEAQRGAGMLVLTSPMS